LPPEVICDVLFIGNPFFDAKDRYEKVRRHRVDGVSISEVATKFGISRPTFYKNLRALQRLTMPSAHISHK
jgi:transposase